MSALDNFSAWIKSLPIGVQIAILFGFLFGLTLLGLWIEGRI